MISGVGSLVTDVMCVCVFRIHRRWDRFSGVILRPTVSQHFWGILLYPLFPQIECSIQIKVSLKRKPATSDCPATFYHVFECGTVLEDEVVPFQEPDGL